MHGRASNHEGLETAIVKVAFPLSAAEEIDSQADHSILAAPSGDGRDEPRIEPYIPDTHCERSEFVVALELLGISSGMNGEFGRVLQARIPFCSRARRRPGTQMEEVMPKHMPAAPIANRSQKGPGDHPEVASDTNFARNTRTN